MGLFDNYTPPKVVTTDEEEDEQDNNIISPENLTKPVKPFGGIFNVSPTKINQVEETKQVEEEILEDPEYPNNVPLGIEPPSPDLYNQYKLEYEDAIKAKEKNYQYIYGRKTLAEDNNPLLYYKAINNEIKSGNWGNFLLQADKKTAGVSTALTSSVMTTILSAVSVTPDLINDAAEGTIVALEKILDRDLTSAEGLDIGLKVGPYSR